MAQGDHPNPPHTLRKRKQHSNKNKNAYTRKATAQIAHCAHMHRTPIDLTSNAHSASVSLAFDTFPAVRGCRQAALTTDVTPRMQRMLQHLGFEIAALIY